MEDMATFSAEVFDESGKLNKLFEDETTYKRLQVIDMTSSFSAEIAAIMRSLYKRFDRITAEKTDSYWGVNLLLFETKRKLELVEDMVHKNYWSNVIFFDLDHQVLAKLITELMREVSGMLKELEYRVKPKDRNMMERVNDFFSLDNNPLAFYFKITLKIKDINHNLDNFLNETNKTLLQLEGKSPLGNNIISLRGDPRNEHRNQYNAPNPRQTMFPNHLPQI